MSNVLKGLSVVFVGLCCLCIFFNKRDEAFGFAIAGAIMITASLFDDFFYFDKHQEGLYIDKVGLLRIGHIMKDVHDWAKKTFNKDAGVYLLKLKKEVDEAVKDGGSIEEMSDVLLCSLIVAAEKGYTEQQLIDGMRNKLEINKKRFFVELPDGTYQHYPVVILRNRHFKEKWYKVAVIDEIEDCWGVKIIDFHTANRKLPDSDIFISGKLSFQKDIYYISEIIYS